jgi:hypothetical protein
MQGEVHTGKTITDLSELVERAEAKAGCYGSNEPSADDPIADQFGAAADEAPFVAPDGAPFMAPSSAPYPGPSAAPKLLGRSMKDEALILAESCVLLSRSLAYIGLADLRCARELSVEIRDHLDAINSYALAKGIGMDLADSLLNLMSVTGDFAVSDATA